MYCNDRWDRNYSNELAPKIKAINIRSDIQYRYARTEVSSYILNPSEQLSQEVAFSMILPEAAFISNFTMQKNGQSKIYVTRVEEKEKAQNTFYKAVDKETSAGLVSEDPRNANQITVRLNVEPKEVIKFKLTYEEFLQRHNSKYEHIIHLNPGQVVPTYNVDIYIRESLPIIDVKVPQLKIHPDDITALLPENAFASVDANIEGDLNNFHIKFHPSEEDQMEMAKLANDQRTAMSGQFIVQYDVDQKKQANEIQIVDGYFVHFFAPDYLESIPKHIMFVLDVSGSMRGTKLEQTKDAMRSIFDDMEEQDYFTILTFNNDVSNAYQADNGNFYSSKMNRNNNR